MVKGLFFMCFLAEFNCVCPVLARLFLGKPGEEGVNFARELERTGNAGAATAQG
jgi:hypothetical protein